MLWEHQTPLDEEVASRTIGRHVMFDGRDLAQVEPLELHGGEDRKTRCSAIDSGMHKHTPPHTPIVARLRGFSSSPGLRVFTPIPLFPCYYCCSL